MEIHLPGPIRSLFNRVPEVYSFVRWYGHGEILKQYAGFPRWVPLPVNVQHGWTNTARHCEAMSDAPENWLWDVITEERVRRAYPGARTRTVGAPFLYFLRNLSYRPLPEASCRGTIVFPCHSAAWLKIQCDFDQYAEDLAALPEEYHPITVCLYFLDYDNGLGTPFLEKGFPVITNGRIGRGDRFLRKFVGNTRGKRYAFSNQMTSGLLFATAMGLQSFLFGPEFQVEANDSKVTDYDTGYHRRWIEEYEPYFRFPDCDPLAQRSCVGQLLGENNLLTRSEMRALLWRLSTRREFLTKVAQIDKLLRFL